MCTDVSTREIRSSCLDWSREIDTANITTVMITAMGMPLSTCQPLRSLISSLIAGPHPAALVQIVLAHDHLPAGPTCCLTSRQRHGPSLSQPAHPTCAGTPAAWARPC